MKELRTRLLSSVSQNALVCGWRDASVNRGFDWNHPNVHLRSI